MGNKIKATSADFSFTCVHEVAHLPPLDPDAEIWFKKARDLQNAPGEKNYNVIAGFYRQAVEGNHYKAMINLQNLLYQGLAAPVSGKTAPEEVIALAEKLMQLNIPAGYYAMGHYLEVGYGVERDKAASLAYFRKSADMGSPEGQYVIGELFLTKRFEDTGNPDPYRVKFKPNPVYRPDIGTVMLSCAAHQGHGEAADWLAGWLKTIKKDYKKAIIYYQLAVKAGNLKAAFKMRHFFNGPVSDNGIYYLAQEKDIERVRRYEIIYQELEKNPSARFPDIDKIVPLPPAPLPDWDGTFEYKKALQK
jgi:TPR repeat protein